MKKWVCTVCGYVWEGENPPEKCPQCGVRLRLTRGCGEKNIVCSQCKHTFHVKA